MNDKLQQICRTLRSEIKNCTSNISYLKIHQFKEKKIIMPDGSTPYIFLVLNGSMRIHTPSGIMDYVSRQYSVSAIDTPLSADVLTFSDNNDFLALSVEFSLNDVLSVVIETEDNIINKILDSQLSADTNFELPKNTQNSQKITIYIGDTEIKDFVISVIDEANAVSGGVTV